MARILIIEDEPTIGMGLQDDLRTEGHSVDLITDGAQGETAAMSAQYDLLLLDVMLPSKDGFSICRTVRAAGLRTPIIMLTAKGQEVDKILGLEFGADDYVTKPFSPRELVARINAALRRALPPTAPDRVFRSGELVIDFGRFEITRAGERIELTALEFKLLGALVAHRGQVLTHDEILAQVWGKDVFLTDRVIYTHVNNLRHKIETTPSMPRMIVGVRGVGYRFDG